MHELLSALKTRLPEVKNEEQDSLLLALLSDAEALIKNLSWQDEVPKELQNTQVRIAVMLYNRMGAKAKLPARKVISGERLIFCLRISKGRSYPAAWQGQVVTGENHFSFGQGCGDQRMHTPGPGLSYGG